MCRRGLAGEVLVKARLSVEQIRTLADSLDRVGPMELERLLKAFVRSTDEEAGLKLLAAMEAIAGAGGVRIAGLRARLEKCREKVQQTAEGLYAKLDADLKKQRERLENGCSR